MTNKQHPQEMAARRGFDIFRRAAYPKAIAYSRVFISEARHITARVKAKRIPNKDKATLNELGWEYDALREYWILRVTDDGT